MDFVSRPTQRVQRQNKPQVEQQQVQEQMQQEEEQKMSSATRLQRLTEAVQAMSRRTDGGWHNDYYFEITNQDGQPVPLPEKDRRLLTQGITRKAEVGHVESSPSRSARKGEGPPGAGRVQRSSGGVFLGRGIVQTLSIAVFESD